MSIPSSPNSLNTNVPRWREARKDWLAVCIFTALNFKRHVKLSKKFQQPSKWRDTTFKEKKRQTDWQKTLVLKLSSDSL